MSKIKIYTPIDAYLDVRLGVIARHSQVGSMQVFNDNLHRYVGRDHNRFWEWTNQFTEAEYNQWWLSRDKECLKLSPKTDFIKYLLDIHNKVHFQNDNEGKPISVTINLWPYELDEKERNELITLVDYCSGYLFDVTLVDIPDYQQNPSWLKANFTFAVLTDFDSWWRLFSHEVFNHPMGDFVMMIPKSYIKPKHEVEAVEAQIKESQELNKEQKAYLLDHEYTLHATLLGYMYLIYYELKTISFTSDLIPTIKRAGS